MIPRPLSRLAHARLHRASRPAGAGRPEADPAQRIDVEQIVTLPEPDGADGDVMGHR